MVLFVISRVFTSKFLKIHTTSVSGLCVRFTFKTYQKSLRHKYDQSISRIFQYNFWRVFDIWHNCVSPPPCTIELRARLYPKYKPAVWAFFGHTAQLAELFYTGVRDEPNIYVLYLLLRLAPRLVSLVFYCILFVLVAQWIMCFPYTYTFSDFLIKHPVFKVDLFNIACKYCC